MRPLSPEEARYFLDVACENKHHVMFELLLVTGLRPGEALGLKWSDVDLDEGRLHIQRTYAPGKGFQEPKTNQSRRVVPLPPTMLNTLREHKDRQALERANTTDWIDQDLVFAGSNGQPVHYRNLVRRHFKPLLKKSGLPQTIRLYDLRHTCATLLLAAGEHAKIVSERLGHASVALTLDTYSHVLPDMQKSASSKLETILYGSEKK